MKWLRFFIPLMSILAFTACGRENQCNISIGNTNFQIEPNSAGYPELNNPGGYMYFSGGHRGVVIIRTALDHFVAFERTCPEDNTSSVSVSDEWGSTLLECPTCHSRFLVESNGLPLEGSATSCPLYEYSTSYSGGILWVY